MKRNTIADVISKHAGNLFKTGAYMIISSIMSSNLRDSTTTTLQEVAKDVRRARNSLRERREQAI